MRYANGPGVTFLTPYKQISMVLSRLALETWLSRDLNKDTFGQPVHKTIHPNSQPIESTLSPTYQRSASSSPPPPNDLIRSLNPASPEYNTGQSTPQDAPVVEEQILCVHGFLDPAKSANMKRISKAWLSI